MTDEDEGGGRRHRQDDLDALAGLVQDGVEATHKAIEEVVQAAKGRATTEELQSVRMTLENGISQITDKLDGALERLGKIESLASDPERGMLTRLIKLEEARGKVTWKDISAIAALFISLAGLYILATQIIAGSVTGG